MPLPPSIQAAQESARQATETAATTGTWGNVFSKSNLLSFGATVGLVLADRYLFKPTPRYEAREVRLNIEPQWPSRRIIGRLEVGGQMFFAGSTIYTNWTPPSGLGDKVYDAPADKDQKVATLDIATWIAEGKLTGLDGIRIGDQFVHLEKTVIDGVDYYTPVAGTPNYGGAFYLRTHFGVDRTDDDLVERYSGGEPTDIENTDRSKFWDLRRKDANHSWVAISFVDTHQDLWDNFGDFSRISFLIKGQEVTDATAPDDKTKTVYTDNVADAQHWVECNLISGQDYDSVSHRHFQDAHNWAAITHDNNYEIFLSLPDGRESRVTKGKRLPFYRDMPPKSKNGTLNIVIEEGFDVQEFRDICDTIRQGFTYEYANKLCVTVGKNLDFTNAVTIDNDDIVDIRPEPQPRRADSTNTLRAQMEQSQAHGYQPIDLEISDGHSVERDGGKITRNMGRLRGMTDYMEVARKLNSLAYRQRFNQRWRITVVPQRKYFKVLPDDPVLVTSKLGRLDNHPTRVIAREIERTTGQITFILLYAPHNEFIEHQTLPPIEQPPGRAQIPTAITDLIFHGRPSNKSNHANVSLEWPSPAYYKNTIISWREENGVWNAGITVDNNRIDTQMFSLDGAEFKIGDVYEFEVVNQNGYGDRSAPYREKWTARSDTAAPPAPSGVRATGLVQGVHITRTKVDADVVPDYAKTTASITYTPTGGTEKTENKEFLGTDAEWRFSDIGKDEKISLSIVVKDVDTAGNESTGVTVTTTTESAVEIAGTFDNFPIGGRFGWNNYQQRTPAENPSDPWDALSWYIYNESPPTPSAAGPPLTRSLFEALGTGGSGSDLITVNPGTIGGANFADFCDANSERDSSTKQFPKFANTLV